MYHTSKPSSKKRASPLDTYSLKKLREDYEIPIPDTEFFRGTSHLDPKMQDQDMEEGHEDLEKLIDETSDKKLKRKLRNRRSAQLSRLRKKKKRQQLELRVATIKQEQHSMLTDLVRQATLNRLLKEQVQKTLEIIYTSPMLASMYTQHMAVKGTMSSKLGSLMSPEVSPSVFSFNPPPQQMPSGASALYEKANAMLFARRLISDQASPISMSDAMPPDYSTVEDMLLFT
eukprot:TRINITY_DN329_c0_g1_i1.p1 TRINITY_DN329_c0_g1~~TRINITY_DN329_c0_g1_i1.p1  ORF type:complete len:230 (+),score=28.24 TRINITY_DN329_c0_g1_i1:822-1511(+)